MRAILILILGFLAGPLCVKTGLNAYKNSKALQAEGKVTTAEVKELQKAKGFSRRRNPQYWVTVSFVPEGRTAAMIRKVLVDSYDYARVRPGATVQITYLPSNPGIIRLSDKVETEIGMFVAGCAIVLATVGYIVYLFWRAFRRSKENATSLPADLPKAA